MKDEEKMRHAALNYHIDNQYCKNEFVINMQVFLSSFVNVREGAEIHSQSFSLV